MCVGRKVSGLCLLVPMLLAGCQATPVVYEHNTRVPDQNCTAARTLAGRYRCEGWALLAKAERPGERYDPAAIRSGQHLIQLADAIDAGSISEAEAAAVATGIEGANVRR